VHELLADRHRVTTFDLSSEPVRLRLLLGDRAGQVAHVTGDIADLASLGRAIDEYGVTNIIHLAALQVPLVRADPSLGARVNVVGTVNVFEAAAQRKLAPIVYASSIAAYDPVGTMNGQPGTLYGVFKRANEATAAVYWAENGISSVGLRPHTVYGVGRDQGLTSAPTVAMLAAAAKVPFTIPYGGGAQLQLARDVARAFIAASLANAKGASVHNVPGHAVTVTEVVQEIANAAPGSSVDFTGEGLPFPSEVDATSFAELAPEFEQTSLADGVRETIERFRELLSRGLLNPPRATQS
jgi:nucleoside-diphosphate-sugar epimerase